MQEEKHENKHDFRADAIKALMKGASEYEARHERELIKYVVKARVSKTRSYFIIPIISIRLPLHDRVTVLVEDNARNIKFLSRLRALSTAYHIRIPVVLKLLYNPSDTVELVIAVRRAMIY